MTKKVEITFIDTWKYTTVQEIPDGLNGAEFAEKFLKDNNYLVEQFERTNFQAQTMNLDTGQTSGLIDIDV